MSQEARRRECPRPFLKWAGGKGQLLPELLQSVNAAGTFRAYYEPFVGSGALFFALHRAGKLAGKVCLSDTNPNLMTTWRAVRDRPGRLVELLLGHRRQHSPKYYYHVRAQAPEELAERAARVIYLNKTCYNGLYRENRAGQFNVPVGRYKNPLICDQENLRAVSRALRGVSLETRSFERVLERAGPGDLVYFDPPYQPLSATSSFTAYSKDGFGEDDQRHLAEVFAELAARDVRVLLSNSMTDLVRDLYRRFQVRQVLANRAVNSRADRRGPIAEALVSNF